MFGDPKNRKHRPARSYLRPHQVCGDSGAQFDDEDESQQHGEGDGHAVVLLDGPTTPEEGDAEDDASNHHKQHGRVEKLITQKVQVLTVSTLDHTARDDQGQTSDLKKEKNIYRRD